MVISDILSKDEAGQLNLAHFHRDGRSHTYLIKADTPPVEPFRRVHAFGAEAAIEEFNSAISLDMIYVWNDAPLEASAQEAICEKLRNSLSRTLSVFPTIAGRLADSGALVQCNGKGIPFRVQRTEGKVEWMEQQPARNMYCDILLGKQVLDGISPLGSIVVTHFDKGGMAMGVVLSHAISDSMSFQMFMTAWSKIHAGEPLLYTPIFELPHPPRQMKWTAEEVSELAQQRGFKGMSSWVNKAIAMMLRGFFMDSVKGWKQYHHITLIFTAEEVKALKKSVHEKMVQKDHADQWVSANEVLNAYIQREMVQMLYPHNNSTDLRRVSRQIVQLRGRFGFPKEYFGNLLQGCTIDLHFDQEFQDVAIELHDKLRARLANEEMFMRSAPFDYAAVHLDNFYTDPALPPSDEPGNIGSWNYQAGIDFFDVDFGLGQPNRGIHWCVGETVKIAKNINDDYEVNILTDYFFKSPLKWIEDMYPTYAGTCTVVVVVALASSPLWNFALDDGWIIGVSTAAGCATGYTIFHFMRKESMYRAQAEYFKHLEELPGKFLCAETARREAAKEFL